MATLKKHSEPKPMAQVIQIRWYQKTGWLEFRGKTMDAALAAAKRWAAKVKK